MSPRLAGSWPGYVFTGAPVSLPAGHFGLGHGGRQHAPDEYLVIEPENPNLRGFDAATLGYVELLHALARTCAGTLQASVAASASTTCGSIS